MNYLMLLTCQHLMMLNEMTHTHTHSVMASCTTLKTCYEALNNVIFLNYYRLLSHLTSVIVAIDADKI